LALPEAKGREAAAKHFASRLNLSEAQVKAMLAAEPMEAEQPSAVPPIDQEVLTAQYYAAREAAAVSPPAKPALRVDIVAAMKAKFAEKHES